MTEQKPAHLDWSKNLGFLSGLLQQLRLVWLLMQDSRVPLWAKLIVPLSLLYLISPLDFIPDVALGLGQLDDLGIILLAISLFIKACPPNLVTYYKNQLEFGGGQPDDEAVDTTYRVVDED